MVNKYIGKQNTPYMDPMGKDATQKKGPLFISLWEVLD